MENKIKNVLILIAVSLITSSQLAAKGTDFQFARRYSNETLMQSSSARDEFVGQILRAESKFFQPGVAFNALSGLTYDGHAIDFDTGELRGEPKRWSASSKESLHLMVLSLAVSGNRSAQILLSPDDPSAAAEEAFKIMERKISSYEKFNEEYPGFGGFFPWFVVSDDGMEPTWDWESRVPALDNGQLGWAMIQAAHILKEQHQFKLSERYENHWRLMAKNAVTIFYDGRSGRIRGTSKILNTKSEVSLANYRDDNAQYHITDPYEGELMTLFMTLFGDWKSSVDPASIWKSKKMEKAVYETKEGHRIAVRRGFWYSVHEMWNFLVLPYTDDPLIKTVFVNGEKARSWHSAENGIPGLLASVNEPVNGNVRGRYLSDVGIPALASVPVSRQDVVAPYGAFPMIMANRRVGLTWLRTMLAAPSMQGPYGATEAASTDGKKIAPLLTWDGKVTTLLALIGETPGSMREALKAAGKYNEFRGLVHEKYEAVFGKSSLEGGQVSFRTPTAEIPRNIPDFDIARKVVDVLRGGRLNGGGTLRDEFELSDERLKLVGTRGFLWTEIQPTDLKTYRFLNFQVRQSEARERGLYIELKNNQSQLITDGKILVRFPNTGNKFETYSVDIGPLVTNPKFQATVFVFSDPEGEIEISRATLTAQPQVETRLLSFNGSAYAPPFAMEARSEGGLKGY